MKSILLVLSILLLPLPHLAQAHVDVAPTVNLNAYMGKWYEIARLPNTFEQDCAANVTAEYTLHEKGEIGVTNACDTGDGTRQVTEGLAWQPDPKVPTKLKVSFVPFLKSFHLFGGDYWIFDVEESQYALVGTPDLKNLWILSRTPELDIDDIDKLLKRIIHMGVETKFLIFTEQSLNEK